MLVDAGIVFIHLQSKDCFHICRTANVLEYLLLCKGTAVR